MADALPKSDTPLAKFCRQAGWTHTKLSLLIGVSYGSACRYTAGSNLASSRPPPPSVMKRIYMVTGGQITPNDLVPISKWRDELHAKAEKAAQEVAS